MDEKNGSEQDDIVLTGEHNTDDPALEDVEASQSNKIKSLQTKLKACEKEKAEHLENLQRAKAEFLNAKKRQEESNILLREQHINVHIEKLLPLADSFEMAMANKDVWEQVENSWRMGIESIYNQLDSILQSYDVVTLNPLNETFDPTFHEALSTVESDLESDTVVEVIQKGYVRNNELIRPAKVILSN